MLAPLPIRRNIVRPLRSLFGHKYERRSRFFVSVSALLGESPRPRRKVALRSLYPFGRSVVGIACQVFANVALEEILGFHFHFRERALLPLPELMGFADRCQISICRVSANAGRRPNQMIAMLLQADRAVAAVAHI